MKEISKQYAEAIFELACEGGSEDAVMTALECARGVFEQNSEYMDLLSSPAIPLTERLATVERTFSGRLPEMVVSLLGLMCEKGRIGGFCECVEEYARLLDVRRSVVEARVISAVPLTEGEKAALKQKLENKCGGTVELSCEVDAAIMGGLIVEMQGSVMDGSLRQRLREVKDVMKA
jgi:F-type H+-transporting ATPase subunit delta